MWARSLRPTPHGRTPPLRRPPRRFEVQAISRPLPLYRVDDQGLFAPSSSTGSPWRHGFQHGGPPCGLLAHLAEDAQLAAGSNGDPPLVPVRSTVELFRAVPQEPLAGTARLLRGGRRLQLWQSALESGDGTTICQANVLFLAQRDESERATLQSEAEPPEIDPAVDVVPMVPREMADRFPPGFHFQVEVRWQQHGDVFGAWVDMPMQLLDGVDTSPFVRAAALADFGNAVNGRARSARPSQIASGDDRDNPRPAFSFINCDSTLMLERPPIDGPLFLCTEQFVSAGGIGTCRVAMYDGDGRCGTVYQASLAQATT